MREVLWTPTFPCDTPKARQEKSRITTEARRKINIRTAWQKLQLILAANFAGGDLFLTLTYKDECLPVDRDAARQNIRALWAELRKHRRLRGQELRYVYNTEGKHGDKRLHHHAVINATSDDLALVQNLWVHGNVEFTPVNEWGHEELAKYMTKEAAEGTLRAGARSWTPSRTLRKPVEYPAEWVDDSMRLEPPANSKVIRQERIDNEFGRYCYMEYMLPDSPKNHRARPRKSKRG